MGSKWVWVLIFVSLAWCLSQGCLDEERVALLQLKHFFNGSPYDDLSDWVNGKNNSDCCQWGGVKCSNSTDKVIKLDLSDTRNKNSGEWYLNASLFLVFEELQWLNLAMNNIAGFIENEGSHKLSRLSNLEYLNLGSNMFNNDILSSLHALSSLKELRLNDNKLKGTIDLQSLNNLESLDLSDNNLDNSILSSIGALSSLKELFLDDIGLEGIVNISELHSLKNLETLLMGNNKINKFILSKDNTSLKNLSWLSSRNISIHDGNNLLQLLGSITSLECLDLSCNNFNETTTTGDFTHLKGTKNLKELHMDHTNLNITFLQISGLLTSSSLWFLTLTNCGLQGTLAPQDGGALAEFLYLQNNLQIVYLSSNNLTGGFPYWFLENNSRLFYLNLANNSLGGNFQLPIHPHMNLTSLDISTNLFHGHIPKEIGGYLPHLRHLYLFQNHFDGSIPSSIGDMNSLKTLDLSYNQLFGKIPEHLVEGCTSLRMLLLSNNSFQGQMFSSNFNLTNLWILQLDGNNFIGKIPNSLSNASDLRGLYLSDNNFSSRLPSWLGNMSNLEDIIMPNNHLEGPIPYEFCQLEYLAILNLADNNLSGSLPYCFNFSIIKRIHLSKNSFQGQLSDFLVNSSFLVTLDLSYNQLHGSIPTWINLNFKLKYLILRNNNLSGELPTQLCQLNQLRLLDLSHNNLSGYIPPCLELTALHDNHSSDVHVDSTHIDGSDGDTQIQIRNEEIVEFTTKTLSYSYEGKVLTYMSGIDLSCNKLIGLIPQQVGNLTRIHTLNLSHNNLIGPIPLTFWKLKQIESLDLSYNNLNGEIPSQLVELNFLTSFSVAHNNLSGKTPERIAQFGTFEENCYVGNPLLCGPPLNKSCDIFGPPQAMPRAPTDNEKDSDFIDRDTFYMSFMGSYIIILIGIGAILYINPYWRRTWFYLIEMSMISFYYFVVDNLPW